MSMTGHLGFIVLFILVYFAGAIATYYMSIGPEYYDSSKDKYYRRYLGGYIYPPKVLWHLFVLVPFIPAFILAHTVNLLYIFFLLLKKIYIPIMNVPLPWAKHFEEESSSETFNSTEWIESK